MPSSTGCPVAGFLPSAFARALISSNSILSICSPWISSVSPGSSISTFCSIWRTITSMCLSLIANALQPIDVLDLVDQIGGKLLDALDRQNVVRRRVAFDDVVALLDDVAILQMDVLALRDQVFPRLLILARRLDGDAALVLVVAAEADRAGDFGDDRGVLRPARLEQLGNPRQTAGDVARLGASVGMRAMTSPGFHLRAGIDRDDGVDGEHSARRHRG